MRILHVSETLPGGVGSYIDDLGRAQSAIVGASNVAVLAPASDVKLLKSADFFTVFPYRQSRRGVQGLWSLRTALRRVVRDWQPDIVHLHSSLAGLVGRMPLAYGRRPQGIVYTAHGWAIDPDRDNRFARAQRWVERSLAGRCDRIVNISPHETAFLRQMRFPHDRMECIATGLAPDAATPRDEDHKRSRGAASGPIRLLFAGRLDRQKGFDRLHPELVASDPRRVVCRVAGAAVRADGTAYPEASHVEMLGWVDRARIMQELAWCDALVMPSRWEGLPIAALEAMRAGRPIIASDRGPFPYMIDHGVEGLLVDIDRPGFLAETLGEFQRSDLHAMGRQAARRFARDYSGDRMVAEMMEAYCTLLRDS